MNTIDILSILLLLSAVGLAVWNRFAQDPYYLIYRARIYVPDGVTLVMAKVEEIAWRADGWFTATLREIANEDSDAEAITLKASACNTIGQTVPLLKTKDNNGRTVYMRVPRPRAHVILKSESMAVNDRDVLNSIAKIVYTITAAATVVDAILVWVYPPAALMVSLAVCVSFFCNRPAKDWQRSAECCIMAVAQTANAVPVLEPAGYGHWSQCERDLDKIAQRVRNEGKECGVEEDGAGKNAVEQFEPAGKEAEEKHTAAVQYEAPILVCPVCGCIARTGDVFCSQCGARIVKSEYPCATATAGNPAGEDELDLDALAQCDPEPSTPPAIIPDAAPTKKKKRSRGHRTRAQASGNAAKQGEDIVTLLDGM